MCHFEFMRRLSTEKRAQMIAMLTEGMSLRSVSRIAGVSLNTVTKLLCEVGEFCESYQEEVFQNLSCNRLEVDEIWSFVGCKEKRKAKATSQHPGDVWTWTCIDAETKLMPCWAVGDRTARTGMEFLEDLASRIEGEVQISADGHVVYDGGIGASFGDRADVGRVYKIYGTLDNGKEGVIEQKKVSWQGSPDMDKVGTSYVERSNLTLRMRNRRFGRKTNAHSKKLENHCLAIGLHHFVYNFITKHSTLKMTPAQAAGVTSEAWTFEALIEAFDAFRAEVYPVKRPKTYKKREQISK